MIGMNGRIRATVSEGATVRCVPSWYDFAVPGRESLSCQSMIVSTACRAG
jgi:hypothetical protein